MNLFDRSEMQASVELRKTVTDFSNLLDNFRKEFGIGEGFFTDVNEVKVTAPTPG